MQLTKKQILEIISYWEKTAKHDFKVAKTLWGSKQYDAALFFCHLTIEKLLKANVVNYTKKHAPYTHDLWKLSNLTGIDFDEQEQENLAI